MFVKALSKEVSCFALQAPLEALDDPLDAVTAHVPEEDCRFVVLQLSENNPQRLHQKYILHPHSVALFPLLRLARSFLHLKLLLFDNVPFKKQKLLILKLLLCDLLLVVCNLD